MQYSANLFQLLRCWWFGLYKQPQGRLVSYLSLIVVGLVLGITTPARSTEVEIRVAVEDKATVLTVGASTNASVVTPQGQVLGSLRAMQENLVKVENQQLRLGNLQAPSWVWLVPAKNGAVYVGDRWYRGRLMLIPQGKRLLAVNYVPLEHYLYSVVGSEMPPGWPMEALKAQAVAARSYGLAHRFRPASPWYDLGDTERWQVYKGLTSEWNSTHAAVNATRGQVLIYGNGLVEAMYAASDAIIREVFGGLGMSQQGAYQLAARGVDYRRILGSFYPGTGLSLIQTRR